MMHCASSNSSTIKLVLCASPATTAPTSAGIEGGGKLACFRVGEESGVDIGAIGRALGLDPASVRLNGYLLGTRGPDHVSASLTWTSLLSFFSSRGLPTGTGGGGGRGGQITDGPIVVQGKPGEASPGSFPGDQNLSGSFYHYDLINECHHQAGGKKRSVFHEGSPLKKEKINQCRSPMPEDEEDIVVNSVCSMKRKLNPDDEGLIDKRRKTEVGSGPHDGKVSLPTCNLTTGSALNCVMVHQKRAREDERVITLPRKKAM